MRWLFLLLLILNIGYVAWELNREQSQPADTAALPKGVARLVLLSELESKPPQDEPVIQAADQVAGQEPEALPSAAAVAPQQQDRARKTESRPAEDAKPDHGATVAADGVADDRQLETPLGQSADKPLTKPAGDLCYTLGPFRELKTLRLVTREIKDYVIEASFRSREEQEQSMFRVFLRPVSSKREAEALIKQLVSKNVRDYFIITDGPNKNGISLGYFSDKGRAHRHAGRIRKLDFDVVVEPVFRNYTIYWLDYRIRAGNEIPQQIFDQHLDNTAQRLSRSCS